MKVYLDTQDFSRFGDVVRGVSDDSTSGIFEQLLQLKDDGDAIFLCSMPLLSELLQYQDQTKARCYAKADAMEALCGQWAIACPSRLAGFEIACALVDGDVNKLHGDSEMVNSRRFWHPRVDDIFDGYRATIKQEIDKIFASHPAKTFTQKRKLKSLRKKFDFVQFAKEQSYEEAENEIGIPAIELRRIFIPFLERKISAAEASRRLFSSVAEPRRFVSVFYERYYEDAGKFPKWISGLGENLKNNIDSAVRDIEPLLELDSSEEMLHKYFGNQAEQYRTIIAKLGYADLPEFLPNVKLTTDSELPADVLNRIPSANLLANVFHGYMEQVLGLQGRRAGFERSVAGDLVHLLYLPHVDLWRSDRRFSALVQRRCAEYSPRVVSKLTILPQRIKELCQPNP